LGNQASGDELHYFIGPQAKGIPAVNNGAGLEAGMFQMKSLYTTSTSTSSKYIPCGETAAGRLTTEKVSWACSLALALTWKSDLRRRDGYLSVSVLAKGEGWRDR